MKRFIIILICLVLSGNIRDHRELYTSFDNDALCKEDETKVIITPYNIKNIDGIV